MACSNYTRDFLEESLEIIKRLDRSDIDAVAETLAATKRRDGRLFLAGSGGGAGHASHAAADFRKIGGLEAYSVSDNVSELTARVNDDGWESSYSGWLESSKISEKDCLFVFSVGGGDSLANISGNLVSAVDAARSVGAAVVGVVGRDGGYVRKNATASVLVPSVDPTRVTTQVEGFQALLWHLLVQHPVLMPGTPKWESVVN